MIRWLPRIELLRGTTCLADDSAANGLCLQLAWLGLVIEIVIAVEERR
jgi:hypothetical protein